MGLRKKMMADTVEVIPKDKLTQIDVLWAMYDNFDASATMHHCLYNVIRKRWDGEQFVSNAALCNRKHRVCDENEESKPIDELGLPYQLVEKRACKTCLKIFNKLAPY